MSERPNLYAPEFWDDPQKLFSRLRQEAPVTQIEPMGMWAVTRYDEVLQVVKNPKVFSSGGLRAATQPPWLGERNPISDSILVLDPPDHTRLRSLLHRAFSAPSMARLEPIIRKRADALVADLLARRQVDFVTSFSLPLPSYAMGVLLDMDDALAPQFKRWADAIVGFGVTAPDDIPRQNQLRDVLHEMKRHLGETIEQRRRKLGEDVVSDLVRAQQEGQKLSDDELMGLLALLLVAGLETTLNALSFCALRLADDPALMERLRAERSLVPAFVEETLRVDAPSFSTMRVTTEDAVLGGVRVPAGSVVMVLFGSANQDERAIPEGNQIKLDRKSAPHLTFGQGIHHCLGAPLARLELRVAMEALLDKVGKLARKPGPVQFAVGATTRGPSALPMEVLPK
jgi:cytochrome P450